ncbi:molybdopterin molybdenumtransferase MoeA [Neisseria weixii]|uniref:Molybdopterin molybdenumtransferase n=1 Tax=Neisseria weixii TaxID=1853276 RepID=A0A3N4NBR9_9NEIS|nr:gephyrin-like molybdotransferase Glp [Neisseria weixii]RPD89540.1 molybdopterin molybdenumtransferase MoeA [Neisseria weixii]RPD89877.1 molybdopterin molybdenumtransferase MoeA [Neisseria weixii]
MIDFEVARAALLEQHPCRLKTVTLPLAQAANRVLAQSLHAKYPSPMFDNSAMDGYAVCDAEGSLREFRITDRIQAGETAENPLAQGEAVRIFTGAPLPPNTTAVVMQEQTESDGDHLRVNADIHAGQNMRLKAEEIEIGQELLAQGSLLNMAALGLAASQGYVELSVYQPLKVQVFSTGNELVEPGQTLSDGQIYDANRYQLLAWLQQLGLQVSDGGILPDDLAQTEAALAAAAEQFDVVITSGGASVGEADYLKQAIEHIGSLAMHTLAVKPGKPFAWGHIGKCKIFILPGNPVATFATSNMLLLPVLNKLAGKQAKHWHLPKITAKAAFQTKKAIKRREFLRVALENGETGETVVKLLPNQGSAMLGTCTAADALCEVPPGQTVSEGDCVSVYLLLH